jgi:beta-glucosidase
LYKVCHYFYYIRIMRIIVLFSAIFFMAGGIFSAPLNLTGTVKELSESGSSVENAVVLLKVNDGLIAYARTLSDAAGQFTLLPGKDVPGEITPIARPVAPLLVRYASYQAMDLKGRTHSTNSLPQGIYVLLGKTESGKSVNLGTVYHRGGALKVGEVTQKEQKVRALSRLQTAAGDEVQLIVRKAGFLPTEVLINSFDENVGIVVLERDPLEARIDSVMNLMTLYDKIYQMTQPGISKDYFTGNIQLNNSTFGNDTNLYGSVLQGGDGYSDNVLNTMNNALNSYNLKIPVTYGKDMMHGAAAIVGATVFPHNIGMGATRDSALVRRACEVTAKESWAGKVDLIFGPAISVPQDERWGRTYEGFGETAELAVMMGAACIRGYQGDKYNAPWRVIATAKHYLADGSTTEGKDRGNNATITEKELREIHLPGYEAAVEQGVLSIMASFNQIGGTHQHVDKVRLTDWLKTELGFDGYVISDWQGIANSTRPGFTEDYGNQNNSPSLTSDAVRDAINAGIDLAMEPGTHTTFISLLKELVSQSAVSQDRIDDAVRRILRAKFRAGRMDNPQGVSGTGTIGNQENRAVAREAVRKSLVLLKNDGSVLPIFKNAKVFVTGSHANNHGYQCGGWTSVGNISTGWQGAGGTMSGATSIQKGIEDKVASGSMVTTAGAADVIIYATGETPYAEWKGDKSLNDLNFTDTQLATLRSQNPTKKIVVIFISGRAMVVENLLSNSDAFVAAWLPGSEGAGIADVLFGDNNFTGKLPFTWPRKLSAIPKNSTEQSDDWFPYGYGLSY